jgi:signal transduction histidine kinase
MISPRRRRAGRWLVVAGLVGFIAAGYAAVVLGLGALAGRSAERPVPLLSVLATLFVAITLEPVRVRLDRMFPVTAEDRLVRITDDLTAALATGDVLPQMARAIGEATSARVVEVRLHARQTGDVVQRWPEGSGPIDPGDPTVTVRPVLSQGNRIGELAVVLPASRVPRRSRSSRRTRTPRVGRLAVAEHRLLDELAAGASLALEGVILEARLRNEVAAAKDRSEQVLASRRRVAEAADAERHRLERDIHDGAQQHLVGVAVGLGLARTLCAGDPARARSAVDAVRITSWRAREALDVLSRGIYPRALTAGGVAAGLAGLAAVTDRPRVTVDSSPAGRWPLEVEAAIYFTCAEAVQNATKHSGADRVRIGLDVADGSARFQVRDDGVGFDTAAARTGTGLAGMRDRVEAVGGTVRVESSRGKGTTVTGRVPLPGPAG